MFRFINTPKRFLGFAAFAAIFAALGIYLPIYFQGVDGVPMIAAMVDKEIGSISVHSERIRAIEFGQRVRTHTSRMGDSLTGYFVYEARVLGSPTEIEVDWSGRPGSAHVTKIQQLESDSRLTVLWSE